ncbi:large-conductance mechanosensitive channel protein MscL [Kamptonema cortianum]|nr:large-conductance mechanosensitive channel protein MscL [Geitlerinema splendidum]MDK3155334.1 large-conductance mechanosensitive channel protein MscL [Kamptonema cortianum]
MSMASEFKEFISKGNVMDLAVGVIIGAAFGKIVDSLVNDVIMPVVGLATGGVDFNDYKFVLKEAAGEASPEVAIKFGSFLSVVLNFVILAFIVFMMVKGVNNLKRRAEKPKPAEEPAPAGPTQEELLAEIRDLMKAKG